MVKSYETILRVNHWNKPLAGMPRWQMQENIWTCRASFVYIFSMTRRKLLIQKRSMLKDANPGCLDLSTGGVFAPDEPHMLNAEREVGEELGLPIRGDDLTF